MKCTLWLIGVLLCAMLAQAAKLPTTLRVVDLRNLSGQPELETWLGSLQGTLNRQDNESAVFLVRNEDDAYWADTLVRTYHLQREVFTSGSLLEETRAQLTGQVRYDPAHPWTRNIALTAAATAPGLVIATETDLGLPTVLDLRTGWDDRAQAYRQAVAQFAGKTDAGTLALVPENGHLLADLITARKLLAVDLSPRVAADAPFLQTVLAAYPANCRVIGSPTGDRQSVEETAAQLAALHSAQPLDYVPARDCANLSCFARFPACRPLVQSRDQAAPLSTTSTLTLIYRGGATIGENGRSLDYAVSALRVLLDDPALATLPVGIETPTALAGYAPAVYQALLARQRMTAAELIAAPLGDPVRAHALDLQEFPVLSVGRIDSIPAFRAMLAKLKGPLQVMYLDPDALPPSLLALLLPEIRRTHTLMSPSQALRAQTEFDAMAAFVKANPPAVNSKPRRGRPTLRVSLPNAGNQAPTAATPIPIAIRAEGAAPVLAARVQYEAPDGRLGVTDLVAAGNGLWKTVLPPMLSGGMLTVRARVVEKDTMGVILTDPLLLKVAGVDTDRDGYDDTLEDYLGSDPTRVDTDGDGLPDSLDVQPTMVDRAALLLCDPILPPADAPLLTDTGVSTVGAESRIIPAGTAITYRLPLAEVPASPAALRLVTRGAGTVAVNGGAVLPLLSAAGDTTADLPLSIPQMSGKELRVTFTAGAAPLHVLSLSPISNPAGPYLHAVELRPAFPPAGVPVTIDVTAYDPQGVTGVRVWSGPDLRSMTPLPLTAVKDGGHVWWTGTLPAPRSEMLVYTVEATNRAGNITVAPFHATTVGRAHGHSVVLTGGRNLNGDWLPATIWGGWGRYLTDGQGEDSHLFLARPGVYSVWVLAQPRLRGVTVTVSKRQGIANEAGTRLARTVPAGSADGWYRLGTFTAAESERLQIAVRPEGAQGYCAYGAVLLTQNEHFTPPLRNDPLDWFNSVTITGIADGQTVRGTISLAVQVTGNIDATEVTMEKARGGLVSDTRTFRFAPQPDGSYTLDCRALAPGDYVIKASGIRQVAEKGRIHRDELLSTSVRVTVPPR